MLIPVYYKGQFVRFVTHRQSASEVAGKILAKRADAFRVASRRMISGLESWVVNYRDMTPAELSARVAS